MWGVVTSSSLKTYECYLSSDVPVGLGVLGGVPNCSFRPSIVKRLV